jgi:hypothetical protein
LSPGATLFSQKRHRSARCRAGQWIVDASRTDLKEGFVIATVVFVVALLLAMLFVYVSVRFQQLGALDRAPLPEARRTADRSRVGGGHHAQRGPVPWPA